MPLFFLACLSLFLSPLVNAMSSRSQSTVSRAGSLTEIMVPIPVPTHYQGVYSVRHLVVVAQLVSLLSILSTTLPISLKRPTSFCPNAKPPIWLRCESERCFRRCATRVFGTRLIHRICGRLLELIEGWNNLSAVDALIQVASIRDKVQDTASQIGKLAKHVCTAHCSEGRVLKWQIV